MTQYDKPSLCDGPGSVIQDAHMKFRSLLLAVVGLSSLALSACDSLDTSGKYVTEDAPQTGSNLRRRYATDGSGSQPDTAAKALSQDGARSGGGFGLGAQGIKTPGGG